MSVFQRLIQGRLSALLGAEVTFEKFNVSLLGGSLDVHGVSVSAAGSNQPLVTVKRVRAELAVTKALKGEFIIKSLTVERPVVQLIRGADGRLNLPRPVRVEKPAQPEEEDDNGAAGEEEGPRKFSFDARKVLIVDGAFEYRDEGSGFHLAADRFLAELAHKERGYELTSIIESVGRRDRPADLGEIKLSARFDDAQDLLAVADAPFHGDLHVGDLLHGQIHSTSLRTGEVEANVRGSVELPAVAPLLPDTGPAAMLKRPGAEGRVDLNARATWSRERGLRVPELTLRATEIALPTS